MVLELVGTKILAPYFGTTIDILTGIISIILAALSVGYWLGGKIAYKKSNYNVLASIFLAVSIIIILTFSLTNKFLDFLTKLPGDYRIELLLASLVIFAPINILLGMVSPYVIRLKVHKVNQSGSISGTYYAVGTLGSIFGTIITGFLLIPIINLDNIIYLTGLVLFVISLLISNWKITIKIVLILLIMALSILFFHPTKNNFLINIDSQYQHISVFDKKIIEGGKRFDARYLLVNDRCCEFGMLLKSPNNLLLTYTKYFNLGQYFLTSPKKFLILGGGGYSFPKFLLANYPNALIDVVEIDPKMTEIAKKYFYLKNSPRLNIISEDARVFLNRNTKKYDVIIVDAYQ